jgi:hypothetical protein
MLEEPRALAERESQPPPLAPPKADDPPLFSCPPQPLEAAELFEVEPYFCVLLELPLHPLPVFL